MALVEAQAPFACVFRFLVASSIQLRIVRGLRVRPVCFSLVEISMCAVRPHPCRSLAFEHKTKRDHTRNTYRMPPRPYFEKQVENNCTMHAANNALGRRELTVVTMRKSAEALAKEMSHRVRANQRKTGRKVESLKVLTARVLPSLMRPTGHFSPDVAFRLLRGREIFPHPCRTAELRLTGRFFITGESTTVYRDEREDGGGADEPAGELVTRYAHSVAVRDGWWLDSELAAPVRLKPDLLLPAYFQVWQVYELKDQPFELPSDDECVDLAIDE